jgi:DNA mismatch repair ATPase MutS
MLDLRRSEYFALLSSLILWSTNLAILVERWRERNQQALWDWQRSLGEFEALLCFARYSYENPDHTFANVTTASAAVFRAESLGHPLLDRRACVTCDLGLEEGRQQVLIVSGSNMSGKSTFLRSVGVNAVLGLAGAPVRAAHLELSLVQIGCSIAIHDSLLDGKSRFQAEVARLKSIMDVAAGDNVLFLLDEVLGGTNSRDRFYGVKAILDKLLRLGAIGLATTHDLALTNLCSEHPRSVTNVHFDEHYRDGQMHFDYVLRLGVLARTNGWNIMVALGLVPPSKERDPCKLS